MDEYIKREAAIKAIEKADYTLIANDADDCKADYLREIIESVPAADRSVDFPSLLLTKLHPPIQMGYRKEVGYDSLYSDCYFCCVILDFEHAHHAGGMDHRQIQP